MNEQKPNRTCNLPTVIYMQPRKPLTPLEERRKEKESLRSYRYGGDDIA